MPQGHKPQWNNIQLKLAVKSATIRNATNGFQKAGIHPYQNDLFTEDDFVGEEMTDKPEPETTSESPVMSDLTLTTQSAMMAQSTVSSNSGADPTMEASVMAQSDVQTIRESQSPSDATSLTQSVLVV